MDDDGSLSPASYIRLVQHLIEKCICYKMDKEECMETLEKHANIKPVITSTVWKELEKENREFFETYKKDRGGEESTQKNPSDQQPEPQPKSSTYDEPSTTVVQLRVDNEFMKTEEGEKKVPAAAGMAAARARHTGGSATANSRLLPRAHTTTNTTTTTTTRTPT